ncbi:MAG TPA: right-handed parallel beta-helix repeat-containing protein [Gaiellales bacterium]
MTREPPGAPRRRARAVRALALLAVATAVATVLLHAAGWPFGSAPAAAAPTAGAKAKVVTVHGGGQLRAALRHAQGGTSILLAGGNYPAVTIERGYSPAITIKPVQGQKVVLAGLSFSGASGVVVRGLRTSGESDVGAGSHDITFDGVGCTLPIGDLEHSCFYLHDSSQHLVVRNSTAVGGFDGVKLYGCSGSTWTSDVLITNNRLTRASEDLIHVNCARNVSIVHNYLHDPIDNDDHNDGVQSQASDGLRIVRNTFTFTRPNPDGPNQAIILGRTGPDSPDLVTHSTISGNLIHHWPGIPIILAGTDDTVVVQNTAWDSGEDDDQGLTSSAGSDGFANTGLRIWNNILGQVWVDPGASAPVLCQHDILQVAPQPGICGDDLRIVDPRFADHADYLLRTTSPAWKLAGTIEGTPEDDLDGAACKAPRLGARCLRP